MKKPCLLIIIILISIGMVHSQVTTSGIRGSVSENDKTTLPGATVLAIHEPSGTQYGAISNKDGQFIIENMRVGGPYKVTVSYIGFSKQVYTDIYLNLGNTANLQIVLTETSQELPDVVVKASKGDVFNSNHTGASTNISDDAIVSIPNISRGLKDFTKISPLANTAGYGTSFAGSHNKFNLFAIDGLMSNDVFGLASTGTNGGQISIEPISLDAIEEFQINIAPYDVRQGGFTGGGINAVTKSGTNNFRGSIYYFMNNENLVGNNEPVSDTKKEYPKYKDYQAGLTLGGPIVKDKLFFFLNAEMAQNVTPLSYAPGSATSNITPDEVNRILATLERVAPGYDPGNYLSIDDETNSYKFLAKLNWNISNNHKLTLRHSYTYGESFDNSRSANSLRFYNNGMFFPSTTNSTGLELNSIFTNNASNKLMLGYTRVRDDRDPLGNPFPQVTIYLSSTNTAVLGSEYSSVANQLDQDIYTLTDNLTLYRGKHTITLGTSNEFYSFYNLFVQNIYGNYYFNSLENFESLGTASEVGPSYYAVGYSFDDSDNPLQGKGAAKFKAMQLGLYGQDVYQVNNKLQITAGLRVDMPVFLDSPEENSDFNSTYASEGKTGEMPGTKIMWSPRLGFNWDVLGDKTLQVRGGAGLFTGRMPFVWLSNQFSNNGQLNGSYSVGSSSSSGTPITSVDIAFSADPYNQPTAEELGATAGRGAINIVDKDLKFPQVFRSNLAIDKKLGWGIVATIEGVFSKTYNNVNFINLNRDADESFTFIGPDQRPRYTAGSTSPTNSRYNNSARIDANYEEIIKFENTDKGYAYNLVLQLQKQFENGFTALAAYNYGHSRDISSGSSSVAFSNWRYVYQVNGLNNLEVANSDYDLGSRIMGFVSYRKDYLKKSISTQVSIFYNGQSGTPLSYLYSGDINNDGTSNDLIYIPETMSDIYLLPYTTTANGSSVTISADEQWEDLNAFIESDDYLSGHRGEYAERNGSRLPFRHQFDLRLVQEFKVNIGQNSNKIQLTLDIINVGNMMNKKWGQQYSGSYCSLINYRGLLDSDSSAAYNYSNQPTFTYTGAGLVNNKPYSTSDLSSRWRMQFGLRYIFN